MEVKCLSCIKSWIERERCEPCKIRGYEKRIDLRFQLAHFASHLLNGNCSPLAGSEGRGLRLRGRDGCRC